MSLKDVFDAASSAVRGVTSAEPIDSAALRAPVFEQIRQAADRWARRDAAGPADWFSQDGDQIAFSPRLANGSPLTIDGQTTVFVPADRFADYLAAMRAQVAAGAFDRQIEAGLGGAPNVSGLASVAMPEAPERRMAQTGQEHAAEVLHRDGHNPDGSIVRFAGEHPDAPPEAQSLA